ncbi:hypothetical protein NL676_021255 [Syzygium grande]|nr:hypothetical protein NL676_021255 [Syzygium grande]
MAMGLHYNVLTLSCLDVTYSSGSETNPATWSASSVGNTSTMSSAFDMALSAFSLRWFERIAKKLKNIRDFEGEYADSSCDDNIGEFALYLLEIGDEDGGGRNRGTSEVQITSSINDDLGSPIKQANDAPREKMDIELADSGDDVPFTAIAKKGIGGRRLRVVFDDDEE